MIEGIDPTVFLTGIIAIIAGAIGVVKNAKAAKYLGIISDFLSIMNEFYSARKDGTYTDEEYLTIGKKFVKFAEEIHKDETIPATIETN